MLMPSILNDNLFDEFFNFPFYDNRDMKKLEKKLYGKRVGNLMKTDIKETDSGYELEMDLPGFTKDDVKASLKDGYLTIRALKSIKKTDEKTPGNYICRERYAGSCERSFYVGEHLTEEDIKAEFKHGILKLMIPKKEERPVIEEKKYIAIEG